MAAIAVLAVAFAVFAAIPAVADDSDAASAESITADQFLGLAKDGKIVLDKDYQLTGTVRVTSDLEIDLAKHTIMTDISRGCMFLVYGVSDVTLKIINGALEASWTANAANNNWYSVADVYGYKSLGDNKYALTPGNELIFENVNVTSECYAIGVTGEYYEIENSLRDNSWNDENAAVKLTITGGNIIAGNGAAAVSTNGNYGGELITINGATLKSEEGSAIYAPSNAHWYVSGCTIEGISGIDVRAGNVTVSDSTTIKYNGPAENKEGGDGPVAFGVGVSVMPVYGYSPAGTNVIIEDSVTFEKGDNATDQLFVSSFKPNFPNSV